MGFRETASQEGTGDAWRQPRRIFLQTAWRQKALCTVDQSISAFSDNPGIGIGAERFQAYLWPKRTYRFKEVCIETIIRNAAKGRSFGLRVDFKSRVSSAIVLRSSWTASRQNYEQRPAELC